MISNIIFKKKRLFVCSKRKINIEQLYNYNNFNLIFQNGISIKICDDHNLFIHKSFDFDFEEYQNKIIEF